MTLQAIALAITCVTCSAFEDLAERAISLVLEKSGFVALLDPSSERLTLFGQVGYRMGKNIGMLVERGAGKCFVWKNESLPASPELLAGYEQFKSDVERLLLEDRGLEGEG